MHGSGVGAALSRTAKPDESGQGWQATLSLTPPKPVGLPPQAGMRTSSWGKQARLEAELHRQDEHVAEADKVRHDMSKSSTPTIINTPTVANEAWGRAGFDGQDTPCPATRMTLCESSVTGAAWSSQSCSLVPNVVRHVKGAEGHLSRRVNCCVSDAGTGADSLRGRSADDQCQRRGRRVVVVSAGATPRTRRRTLATRWSLDTERDRGDEIPTTCIPEGTRLNANEVIPSGGGGKSIVVRTR